MTTSDGLRTVLLLVDIQQGFHDPSHWGTERSTPNFEENIARLLKAFRSSKNCEIFHVCHHSRFEASPIHPSKSGVKFMEYAAPSGSERVFTKTTNSPFVETDLAKVIKDLKIDRLVVAGLTTAHCVATTIRAAAELRVVDHSYGCPVSSDSSAPSGQIILLKDATATYNAGYGGQNYDAETIHGVYLATLKDEFCDIGTTDEVIRSLNVSNA